MSNDTRACPDCGSSDFALNRRDFLRAAGGGAAALGVVGGLDGRAEVGEDGVAQVLVDRGAVIEQPVGDQAERLVEEGDETLRSEAPHPVNRFFVIRFPDRATRERFFDDAEYLEIKARLFEASVAGVTIVGEIETT